MDDELKAIQADLDSVLDRLAEYMSSDKLSNVTPLDNGDRLAIHDAEPQPSTREDAARTVFQYAASPGYSAGCLESAIFTTRKARKLMRKSDSKTQEERGEDAESLWSAMEALQVWNQSQAHPLEHHHMLALWRSAFVFLDQRSEYFGEEAGLLHPKKTVDRKRLRRFLAANEAWGLHLSDPKEHPVDDHLFRLAGERYHLSGGVVKRAYYSDEMKAEREEINRLWRLELKAMEERGDHQ